MHPRLLNQLRCPQTGSALTLVDPDYRGELIWHGDLVNQTGKHWPIRDGIVDLMPSQAAWNPAQLLNRLPVTAWAYERLWREQALTLLSGRDFPVVEEVAMMHAQIAPQRQGIFLDLACSNGLYARYLAQVTNLEQQIVVGLDHSLPMLREAQRRARKLGLSITWIRGLADQLPFADTSIAGVVCGGSFNEFTNPDRVISEVRRILNADGRSFWMQAQQAPQITGRLLQTILRPGGVIFWPADALKQALTSAGLFVHYDQRIGAIQMIATKGRIIANERSA